VCVCVPAFLLSPLPLRHTFLLFPFFSLQNPLLFWVFWKCPSSVVQQRPVRVAATLEVFSGRFPPLPSVSRSTPTEVDVWILFRWLLDSSTPHCRYQPRRTCCFCLIHFRVCGVFRCLFRCRCSTTINHWKLNKQLFYSFVHSFGTTLLFLSSETQELRLLLQFKSNNSWLIFIAFSFWEPVGRFFCCACFLSECVCVCDLELLLLLLLH